MRLPLALLGLFWLTHPASAQDASELEIEIDGESVLVVAPMLNDDENGAAQAVLGEISLNAQAEQVMDNGVRWRLRSSLRLQQDNPRRPGGIGGFGSDSMGPTGAPVGAFSGLSSATPLEETGVRGRWETAYLQIDGGYGELRIGKDQGVAYRFQEGPKSVLSHARLDTTLLDPSGLAIVRTRADLGGPSAKLSYASPRLLGVRAGLTYTPVAITDGLDRRPAAGTGLTAPESRDIFEIALNGTHTFRATDTRIDVGVSWTHADTTDQADLAPYSATEVMSAGTRIEIGEWTLGGAWLASDNGLPNGDYTAFTFGMARPAYGIDWSFDYGQAEDNAAELDSASFRFGGAYPISETASVAIAYSRDRLESGTQSFESQGIVVEITLSSEILNFSGN